MKAAMKEAKESSDASLAAALATPARPPLPPAAAFPVAPLLAPPALSPAAALPAAAGIAPHRETGRHLEGEHEHEGGEEPVRRASHPPAQVGGDREEILLAEHVRRGDRVLDGVGHGGDEDGRQRAHPADRAPVRVRGEEGHTGI